MFGHICSNLQLDVSNINDILAVNDIYVNSGRNILNNCNEVKRQKCYALRIFDWMKHRYCITIRGLGDSKHDNRLQRKYMNKAVGLQNISLHTIQTILNGMYSG